MLLPPTDEPSEKGKVFKRQEKVPKFDAGSRHGREFCIVRTEHWKNRTCYLDERKKGVGNSHSYIVYGLRPLGSIKTPPGPEIHMIPRARGVIMSHFIPLVRLCMSIFHGISEVS